jgi:multidrug resistance efflux pump
MNSLPPIPTPLEVQWREFRYRYLPLIVFAGVVGASALLWRDVTNRFNLVGTGEGVRSSVSCSQPAVIQRLLVMPYQIVRQGEPIAVVLPMDPRVQFDMLNAGLQLARLRLQPSLAEQSALDYERLRVEVLRTKSELAVARVNLERAENDLRRNIPLYQDKLVSEEIYDLSLKTRDLYKAEIEAKGQTVEEIEKRMNGLSTLGEPDKLGATNPVSRVVSELERALVVVTSNCGPVTLLAPIGGMVGPLCRQPGECLLEGEPLITISALECERIVGYLRQPYPVDPQVGMPVQVTTRNRKRTRFQTEIVQIGAQLETITNATAYLAQGALVDSGLPIVVNIPNHIQIRPGEIVDMLIKVPNDNGALPLGNQRREDQPGAAQAKL